MALSLTEFVLGLPLNSNCRDGEPYGIFKHPKVRWESYKGIDVEECASLSILMNHDRDEPIRRGKGVDV
jgi:hypothetical protein